MNLTALAIVVGVFLLVAFVRAFLTEWEKH